MVTPARNMLDESFRIATHQSHMSVTVSPSPQKNITLSDSLDYAAEDVTKNPSVSFDIPVLNGPVLFTHLLILLLNFEFLLDHHYRLSV